MRSTDDRLGELRQMLLTVGVSAALLLIAGPWGHFSMVDTAFGATLTAAMLFEIGASGRLKPSRIATIRKKHKGDAGDGGRSSTRS